MNQLKHAGAWIHTFLLLLAALILSRAALAALRLGEMLKIGSETANGRAITFSLIDMPGTFSGDWYTLSAAWSALSAAILHELARTALTCTVKWSGRSQRLYVLVNQARV